MGSTPAGHTNLLTASALGVVHVAKQKSLRSSNSQKRRYHPKQSCARRMRPRALESIGECLYRDTKTGILQAVVKQTENGKKVQHRRSLRTVDIVTARLRLAESPLQPSNGPACGEEFPPVIFTVMPGTALQDLSTI